MRFTNLDMDAMRSFLTGFEAGSFTRAAERLGRSTSAVSAQLKKLEEQAGVPLVRRSGRGLTLTDAGEALLSYSRRLLELNDEALCAVRGVDLEGWVRLGLQEDFGETILPTVLARFARAHPKVRVEGRIARNAELLEKIASGHLDLALAWDVGETSFASARLAILPLCWLSAVGSASLQAIEDHDPVPLVVLEAPCVLRTMACEQLDRIGRSWRIAFVSPSVGGLWAAAAAGLGLALRTPFSRPRSVQIMDPLSSGLPKLGSIGLVLHRRSSESDQTCDHLAAIIVQSLSEILDRDWLNVGRN